MNSFAIPLAQNGAMLLCSLRAIRRLPKISALIAVVLFSSVSLADDSATLEGTIISIPVVIVGEVDYSLKLALIPGSNPLTLSVTEAVELTNADRTSAATLVDGILNIPSIQVGDDNLNVDLLLVSESPLEYQLNGFSVNVKDPDAFDLFEANISSQIIDARCSVCHFDGGAADESSLIYTRSGENHVLQNFEAIQAFAASKEDALDYILEKASGGLSHGGGAQLAVGSSDYNNLEQMLSLLITGSSAEGESEVNFFSEVEMLSPAETLRRAAIIFAGRVPSDAEYASVASGEEDDLRIAIRNIFEGDNFHDFLLEGANDRLLVRGVPDDTFLDGGGVFQNFVNHFAELKLADYNKGLSWSYDQGRFVNGVDRGLRDSPLELIAHVVENDRSYEEILTADYMMTNPIAAWAMGASGPFENPKDFSDFQPVSLDKYYAWSDDVITSEIVEIQNRVIDDPGSLHWEYPHAGVLNTQAYLFRYPTTATNRNRARARWTFYHFLGVDIEKSAPRTTDPVALADTNNPTMFNNNCTVCHATMDPVAGAFQLYGEEGHFKTNGYDSLDNAYKYPEDWESRIYQEGDTWYRDMRTPGFNGAESEGESSLQWLAQELVQDPSFPAATVKFWWPAVFGTEVLEQPAVQSDATYQSQLLAYNAQSESIAEFAERFDQGGMLLKDLFVDMVVSPWFRSASVDSVSLSSEQLSAHDIANLGSERLLTPEQLARKTTSLTGFTLDSGIDLERDLPYSALSRDYAMYYGGIDSAGVTTRASEMTALMSTVAMTHAVESSCPIVLREFALQDGSRALFNGIDEFVTPVSLGNEQFELETHYDAIEEVVSVDVYLPAEPLNILVSINDGFCDWNRDAQVCDSNNSLQEARIEVTGPDGITQEVVANEQTVELPTDCGWLTGTGIGLCNRSAARIAFIPASAGEYRINATLSAVRYGSDHPSVESISVTIGAETTDANLHSSQVGAAAIKAKIIELHETLHGKSYTTDDIEIQDAYQLFVESWEDVRSLPNATDYSNIAWGPDLRCKSWSDYRIGEGMPTDITPTILNSNPEEEGGYRWISVSDEMNQYISETGSDPFFVKQAWVTVMTYMLSHYNYLYE